MLDFFPKENDFIDEKYRIEIWADVTNNDVPNIVPGRYKVSTWGRFYDCFNGKYYPTENVKSTSYPLVHIQFIDGSYKTLKIHHIVLKKFKVFDYKDESYTDVDHKDGIRYHNWVWNLETVTHKENIQRCVKNGQYPLCENQQNAVLTNDQVHKICDLISKGYMVSEIVKILKPEIPIISKHLISDIKFGRNYSTISKNYDFSNMHYYNTQDQKFNDEFIQSLCKIFEIYGTNITPKQAALLMGFTLNYQTKEEQARFRNVFYNIKDKKLYKNICLNYNY